MPPIVDAGTLIDTPVMEATTNQLPRDVVAYSDISKAVVAVDRSRPVKVLLTRTQAQYFRRHLLMMCAARRRATNSDRFESLRFHVLQWKILFRFPRLLELGFFYEIDDGTLDRVNFDDVPDGVLVTFLPKAT